MHSSRSRILFRAAPVVLALVAVAGLRAAGASTPEPTTFLVGTARVSISPTFPYPDGSIYIGGVFPGPLRKAGGNLAPTYARAVAISTDVPGSGIILGEMDEQGAFAAYQQGPYGLSDIQSDLSKELGLDPWRIILGTDHTHAGADGIGVWGGVPVSYLKFMKDRYEEAAREAWANRKPATLSWASTLAPDMLQNQSRYQTELDTELRVLVARDPSTNEPFAFLPNWQGHPSIVPGTDLHPDWPGILDDVLEARNPGSMSMAMPGDVGRTQTGQQGNTDATVGLQKATSYATTLADRIGTALASGEHPVALGPVTSAQVSFTENSTNPLILGLFYAGQDGVATIYRSRAAPWIQGPDTIGARATTARIGNIVLGAPPGEAYPVIHSTLAQQTGAETFFLGLANDQLGYLIAPQEDVPFIAADGNDNTAFMLSPSMGDHVECALIKAATADGFAMQAPPARCAQWSADRVDGGQ